MKLKNIYQEDIALFSAFLDLSNPTTIKHMLKRVILWRAVVVTWITLFTVGYSTCLVYHSVNH